MSTCTKVLVTTPDEVVRGRNIPKVNLIKIDTETTEPDVLRGMKMILSRDKPDLLFEVLPEQGTGAAISHLLRPLGYKFYLLRETGPELQKDFIEYRIYWNYLARATGG